MNKKQIDALIEQAKKAKPPKRSLVAVKLTDDKKYFLLKAKASGLSYRDMAVLWEKLFNNKISIVSISRYMKYLRNT